MWTSMDVHLPALVPPEVLTSAVLGSVVLLTVVFLAKWAMAPSQGKRIPATWFRDYGLYSVFTSKMPDWAALAQTWGPVFRTRFLGKDMVVISGAANVRATLNADVDVVRANLPAGLHALLGEGNLMSLHGKAHARQRRLLLLAFTPANLRGYTQRLGAVAEAMTAEWGRRGVISGHKDVRFFVVKVAAEVVMGFDSRWTSPSDFERINQLYLDLWNAFFTVHIDLPGTTYRKGLRARAELEEKIENSMQELLQHRDELPHPEAPQGADGEKPSGRSVVEVLLSAKDEDGNPLTPERIVSAATALLLGAIDTTATSLMMAIKFMAQHPDAAAALRQEQATVVATHGPALSDAALRAMLYADAFLKETLRLESPTRVLFRKTMAEYEVEGYRIPAGQKLLVNVGDSIAHDARWAEDSPGSFRPERWLRDEGQKAGAWVPFGGGPRLCLGQQLAWVEMKAMVAVLSRGYDVELLDPKEKWNTFPLMYPAKGMPLKVTPRVDG